MPDHISAPAALIRILEAHVLLRSRLLPLLPVLLAACGPSPEQLRGTLKQHPELLAEAIREHPVEIMEALQAAADSYQHLSQARTDSADEVRITRELAAPRHPVLQPGRATIGAPEAVITIVEYSDFQCPYCRREVPVLKQLLQRHPGQVRLVLKQTPLPTHAHAAEAARMFEAVLRQGQERAWRYYDLLFENQERLAAEGGAYLDLAARAVGADVARARRDASSEEIAQIIAADQAEFQEFGFTGTPGFLVNGVVLDGSKPLQVFERVILRVLGGQAPPATLTRPEPSGPR